MSNLGFSPTGCLEHVWVWGVGDRQRRPPSVLHDFCGAACRGRNQEVSTLFLTLFSDDLPKVESWGKRIEA